MVKLTIDGKLIEAKKGSTILEAAKLTLNDNIKYEITKDKSQDGIVLDQNISGTKVEEGTKITLTVGKYQVDISTLISKDMSIDEATSILVENGISYELIGNGDLVDSFTQTINNGETVKIKTKKSEPEVPSNNENNNRNITNSKNSNTKAIIKKTINTKPMAQNSRKSAKTLISPQ